MKCENCHKPIEEGFLCPDCPPCPRYPHRGLCMTVVSGGIPCPGKEICEKDTKEVVRKADEILTQQGILKDGVLVYEEDEPCEDESCSTKQNDS